MCKNALMSPPAVAEISPLIQESVVDTMEVKHVVAPVASTRVVSLDMLSVVLSDLKVSESSHHCTEPV